MVTDGTDRFTLFKKSCKAVSDRGGGRHRDYQFTGDFKLPKGTEHFITDIHGEYDQFQHVLKNGSGAIKRKIEDEFGNAISQAEKKSIATLIYYPEQKMEQVIKTEENMETGTRSHCTA